MNDKSLLCFVFWKESLKEIVEFLKEKEFHDIALLKHMEEVLHGTKK